jgi:hypothetical protein
MASRGFGLLILAAVQAVAPAYTVPSGTVLHVRLTQAVSSQAAHRGDSISATLIAPVEVGDKVIPMGATVRGTIDEVTAHSPVRQARLRLSFDRLDSGTSTVQIAATLVAVDNAREAVGRDGVILGPVTEADRALGRVELLALAALVPEIFVLDVAGSRLREGVRVDITYPIGVDLDLQLTRPFDIGADGLQVPPPAARVPTSLVDQIRAFPIRTAAGRPPREADMVNIVFLGSASGLTEAFARAGWSTADALSARADVKTFLAIASREGYQRGPVSRQTLDGRSPDEVFQKQTNTFAKRHHVRIWRHGLWNGRQLWAAAATHDIGVKFTAAERTFTHRVESQIDLERDKIANDLMYAGVPPASFVDQPAAPRAVTNATQDELVTDGRIAVIDLGDR